EERLAARELQGLLEPPRFGTGDVGAERGELVPPAAGIAARPRLFDQALVEQPLDDAVERSGAEPDDAIGQLPDLVHDGVAVRLAVRKRDQHMEERRCQRQERLRISSVPHGGTYVVSRYGVTRHIRRTEAANGSLGVSRLQLSGLSQS